MNQNAIAATPSRCMRPASARGQYRCDLCRLVAATEPNRRQNGALALGMADSLNGPLMPSMGSGDGLDTLRCHRPAMQLFWEAPSRHGSFTVHAWHSGLVASWHYAPHPVFLTLLTTALEVGKTAARHRPHTTAAPIWAPIQRQWAAKHGGLFRKNAGYSKRTQRRWASFFSSAMRRLALSCFCSSCMRSRSVTLPSSLICSS